MLRWRKTCEEKIGAKRHEEENDNADGEEITIEEPWCEDVTHVGCRQECSKEESRHDYVKALAHCSKRRPPPHNNQAEDSDQRHLNPIVLEDRADCPPKHRKVEVLDRRMMVNICKRVEPYRFPADREEKLGSAIRIHHPWEYDGEGSCDHAQQRYDCPCVPLSTMLPNEHYCESNCHETGVDACEDCAPKQQTEANVSAELSRCCVFMDDEVKVPERGKNEKTPRWLFPIHSASW